MIHNVTIRWQELVDAFTNIEHDRIYFLDKITGDIFFVSPDIEEVFWEQVENQQERFLEIPPLDRNAERQLLSGFLGTQEDEELKKLVEHAFTGKPPYVKTSDILEFFPEEGEQFAELRDSFLSNRVKTWLEEHNLFSFSSSFNAVN